MIFRVVSSFAGMSEAEVNDLMEQDRHDQYKAELDERNKEMRGNGNPDVPDAPAGVPAITVAKIYAYIAACGLLWSNWCEYKLLLGVEFGEYSLRQYRYAKDYYRYAAEMIREMEVDRNA